MRLEELKVKSMGDLSDATPYFSFSRLIKVFIYHMLNFLMIGPMAYFPVVMVSGHTYAKNIAFFPAKPLMPFFMIQVMQYMLFAIPVALLIWQRIHYGRIKMDLYPLILYIIMTLYRIFIISIRHATTPPRVYREMFTHDLTVENRNEGLMFFAWAEINEQRLKIELTRALLKNDVYQDYFKFKTFLPVWPQMRDRLLREDYYEKIATWNGPAMKDENARQTKEVGELLDLFKEAQFNKKFADKDIEKKSAAFDENWEFINSLVFGHKDKDCETLFKGHLWVKELFIMSSFKAPRLSRPINMMIALVIAAEWPVVKMIRMSMMKKKAMKMGMMIDMSKMPSVAEMVIYHLPLMMGTMMYCAMNLMFINVSLTDIQRRNIQMQLLSQALEINFQEKNGENIRLPTLNFIDPKTMTAWLEARKLVLDIGSRFIVRIQYYMSTYFAIAGLGTLFVIGYILKYIQIEISLEVWICLGTILVVLDVYVLLVLWPYSYVNEQTAYQIKRLVFLKGIMQRIIRDDDMLVSNVNRIRQLVTRKAVQYLQEQTADIEDRQERREKMLEMAGEAYDGINEAIELLEKELEHTPQKLLGLAMYPDRITGILSAGAMFAFTTASGAAGIEA